MSKTSKIIIVGGGVAGLFLSANLSVPHILIEQNSSLGKKLLASGGGKCNLTNAKISAQNYHADAQFISKVLSNLSHKDALEFFGGVEFRKLKDSQFFANSSKMVLNSLLKRLKNAEILLNTKVIDATKRGEIFELSTTKGVFKTQNLVIATGGLSYPNLGVSDIGYKIALKFGHEITPLSPALVGLSVQKSEFWFRELSGVSLRARMRVGEIKTRKKPQNFSENYAENLNQNLGRNFSKNGEICDENLAQISNDNLSLAKISAKNFKISAQNQAQISVKNSDKISKNSSYERELFGDLLFTHKGLSGPLAMNASLFWESGSCEIDFLPKNFDFAKIRSSKKEPSSLFGLPKSFIKAFLGSINLESKPVCKYSDGEFLKLLKLKNYKFAPAGNFGFSRAEVTKGGIKTDGITQNCMSKNAKNLYFLGEILDATGMIGGFNIHFALSCAVASLKSLES